MLIIRAGHALHPSVNVSMKLGVVTVIRNFAQFLILCFAKFTSNFAKFSETRIQNLGSIFPILQKEKIF